VMVASTAVLVVTPVGFLMKIPRLKSLVLDAPLEGSVRQKVWQPASHVLLVSSPIMREEVRASNALLAEPLPGSDAVLLAVVAPLIRRQRLVHRVKQALGSARKAQASALSAAKASGAAHLGLQETKPAQIAKLASIVPSWQLRRVHAASLALPARPLQRPAPNLTKTAPAREASITHSENVYAAHLNSVCIAQGVLSMTA